MALALVAMPTAALARGESWVIVDVDSGGCDSGNTSFDIFTVYPDGGNVQQNTMVFVGTAVYMDEIVDIEDATTDSGSWGIYNSNDRGRQTTSFPLPTDTPYRMTNEIRNSDGQMIWESTVILDSCNASNITLNVQGPASERLANGGFEKAGGSEKEAKKWGGDDAGLSKRFCDPESDRVYEGECSLQLKPASNQKSKVSQSTSPDLVEVDDVIRLSAVVRAEGLQGGGKLVAVVNYKGGTKDKITIPIPEGDYDFTWLADDVVVTDEVTGVDVSIQTKKGSGRFYVDDIELTEIANGVPLPDPPILF